MRSVKIGNLIICKHVFDNWASRYSHLGDFDFEDRDQRIDVARQIQEQLGHAVRIPSDDQTIFVYLWEARTGTAGIAYPAEIGKTLTKIVTSYPAGQSLVNKAKLLQGQCQCQIPKISPKVKIDAR